MALPTLLKSLLGCYDTVRPRASSSGSRAVRNAPSTDVPGLCFSTRVGRSLRGHVGTRAEFGIDGLTPSSRVMPS